MTDQPRPAPSTRAPNPAAIDPSASDHSGGPRHSRMLPHPAPADDDARLLLFAFRRMAQHGLRDAVAAERLLGRYGLHYRGPLVLLRAFVLELAQSAARTIAIGHCCMPRMTADEAAMLGVLNDPEASHRQLASLMGGADPAHARQIAACLARTLAEARA